MNTITIKADRVSQVYISNGQWDLTLESALEGRARAAFIVSETIAGLVNFEIESETDIHIFTILKYKDLFPSLIFYSTY